MMWLHRQKLQGPREMNTPATMKASLYQDWMSLVCSFGVSQNLAESAWLDVMTRYEENGRYYHNLTHIYHMLEVIEIMNEEVEDKTAVLFATWFHDIIYDPQKSNNEEMSAAYAQNILSTWQLRAPQIEKVVTLIMATKTHEANDSVFKDSLIFLDVDLAILGAEKSRYQAYAWAIRQEYHFVPEQNFRNERSKILQSFLSRDVIYFTHKMQVLFQKRACQNMHWELKTLTG
jgi:predicted metal-dependent HD superfamily phosphohydrolase